MSPDTGLWARRLARNARQRQEQRRHRLTLLFVYLAYCFFVIVGAYGLGSLLAAAGAVAQ